MIFVFERRSRKVIPEELVTLMAWDPRDFLSCLVMVRKGTDVVKEGALDLSCQDAEIWSRDDQ